MLSEYADVTSLLTDLTQAYIYDCTKRYISWNNDRVSYDANLSKMAWSYILQ